MDVKGAGSVLAEESLSNGDLAPAGQLVTLEIAKPIAWIRLNQPDTMNPLSEQLLDELNSAVDRIENDAAVRVVVLTGSGRAFSAGAELTSIASPDGSIDGESLLNLVRRASATFERLPALNKPVIAAVNGYALAGGMELMMACDMVIAAQSARIGDAHSNYGLLPGSGGAVRLARLVGPMVAKYLAFTGNFVPAADLVPFGLVNEVVPDEELHDRVDQLARQLASKSPRGLAHMKRLIDDGLEQPLATALRLEHQATAVHMYSCSDMQEGLAAFREKRKPLFTDQ